ncbi:hypothetical protein SVIO_068630 [Streptomyces violaceusniger]|uniref:Uncharacterized protein n=1 Tax=Streptomyces violaceusniger TaxID=68280 RepID=A0A4D4LB08_STRVO|nr:hypothetical protein SVIO_068630 [Streptomyces violaceusniger]
MVRAVPDKELLSNAVATLRSDLWPWTSSDLRWESISAVGEDLQKAIQWAVRSGLGYSVRGAENKGRFIDLKSPNQYEVCLERSVPELKAIMFYVVPVSTECPPKVGS